jgi:hypothetical protein
MYNYADPFSCECRSFGRLQEVGREDLAIGCFGYLLLDEEHEQIIKDKFSKDVWLEFDGNGDNAGAYEVRSRYLGKSGKPPPIRGILKQIGSEVKELKNKDLRRILRNITCLQQLGIIHIDIAERQLISGKICDFSRAITVPHFITNPELSPWLTPSAAAWLQYETFFISINDYWEFDNMVLFWNEEHPNQKAKLSAFAFHIRRSSPIKYNLRSTPLRDGIFTFVNPMKYDWRASATLHVPDQIAASSTSRTRQHRTSSRARTSFRGMKTKMRLDSSPQKWYLSCKNATALRLKRHRQYSYHLEWYFVHGKLVPRRR